MGFSASVDPNVEQAREEVQSGGGSFRPLPKGKYSATIVPLGDDKSFEVVDFSPNNPAYAGKKALRVKVRIVDDSPTGAKRTFFARVPLFSRYAPSQKNPAGAAARGYFDFFEKAIGVPTEQVLKGILPGPEALLGKRISITLSDPIAPDKWNELGSNEVAFWDAAGSVASTPTGAPNAPWLDEHGNLRPDWVSSTPSASAPAGAPSAPADVWATPSTPAAAQQAPADPWGAVPAEDPVLAAAAAQGGSY